MPYVAIVDVSGEFHLECDDPLVSAFDDQVDFMSTVRGAQVSHACFSEIAIKLGAQRAPRAPTQSRQPGGEDFVRVLGEADRCFAVQWCTRPCEECLQTHRGRP